MAAPMGWHALLSAETPWRSATRAANVVDGHGRLRREGLTTAEVATSTVSRRHPAGVTLGRWDNPVVINRTSSTQPCDYSTSADVEVCGKTPTTLIAFGMDTPSPTLTGDARMAGEFRYAHYCDEHLALVRDRLDRR